MEEVKSPFCTGHLEALRASCYPSQEEFWEEDEPGRNLKHVATLFPLLTSPFNQLSSNPYVVTAPQETTGKNWEMTSVFFFPILLPPSSLSLAEPHCLASTHAHFESSRSFLSCCHPDMGIYVHLSLSCSNLSWALFTPMPIENLIPKSCCHKVLGTLRHLKNSQS